MTHITTKLATDPFTVNAFHNDIEQAAYTWSTLTEWGPIRVVWQFCYKLYLFFFAMPMFYLYLNGPSMYGYAPFWGGRSLPEICFSLTSVESRFWMSSDEKMRECDYIVFQQFHSFMVGVFSIVYVFIMGKLILNLVSGIQRSTHQVYSGVLNSIYTTTTSTLNRNLSQSAESSERYRRTGDYQHNVAHLSSTTYPNDLQHYYNQQQPLDPSGTIQEHIIIREGNSSVRRNYLRRSLSREAIVQQQHIGTSKNDSMEKLSMGLSNTIGNQPTTTTISNQTSNRNSSESPTSTNSQHDSNLISAGRHLQHQATSIDPTTEFPLVNRAAHHR